MACNECGDRSQRIGLRGGHHPHPVAGQALTEALAVPLGDEGVEAEQGVVFAVAASNENDDACDYSPAAATQALTVGATSSSDTRASFSNYGYCLDLFAPGVGITSAFNTGDDAFISCDNDGGTGSNSSISASLDPGWYYVVVKSDEAYWTAGELPFNLYISE